MQQTNWDLSEPVRKNRNLPWYLPSINRMFVRQMGLTTREMRPGNIPASLPNPEDLNFLLPSSFYYYPCCLYSAGACQATSRFTS